MRILGGHDYYDNALAFGQDPPIVYIRKSDNKVPCGEFPLSIGVELATAYRNSLLVVHVVWFCGIRYQGVSYKEKFFWSAASLSAILPIVRKDCYPREISKITDLFPQTKYRKLDDFFAPVTNPADFDAMLDRKATVVALEGSGSAYKYDYSWRIPVHIDPDGGLLKKIEFYKAVPHLEAFQRISQWVGGVLANNANPPQIPQKYRFEERGFDNITSFRKEATKTKKQ